MKKYPIYYNGKQYEVRWCGHGEFQKIKVYLCKGKLIRIPLPLLINTSFITNKYKYCLYTDGYIISYRVLNDENDYINQAKNAVKQAAKIQDKIKSYKQSEKDKKKALKEWNGEIL